MLFQVKIHCLDFCKSEPGCNWFTFSPAKGFCQLFENCLVLDLEKCPDCKSGHRNCHDNGEKCKVQGECKGVTIESEGKAQTTYECLKLCNKTPGCGYYTFYKDILHCSLFETCSLKICDNCYSEEIGCLSKKTGMSL